ncbi:MAG: hypothetical protein HQM02_03210 [Magnetococcales bacterium]|nr:hypothetical protein [Magnetococcales bacterium]
MKLKAMMMLSVGLMLSSGVVYAGADDMKWVAKCMTDNADAKVPAEVVSKYCTCMNNKMDESETQSISTWEKSHPQEMKACEREAGWK